MTEQNPTSMEEWSTETQEVSVQDLDQLAAEIKNARADYEAKKKVSSEANALVEKLEGEFVDLLKASGKSKYFVDGVGTLYIITKDSFKTPKTVEDKRKLFEYMEKTHGKEFLDNMLSINSMTLNAWANKEIANKADATIPGLEMPTTSQSLGLRKEK